MYLLLSTLRRFVLKKRFRFLLRITFELFFWTRLLRFRVGEVFLCKVTADGKVWKIERKPLILGQKWKEA